jgi:hypothetical protein
MATERRDAAQRELHLVTLADMYLQGKTQNEMAAAIGKSTDTVGRDLVEIKRRWVAYTTLAFDEHVAQELARIDAVERQAWDAWYTSGKPSVEIHQQDSTSGTGKRAQRRRLQRNVQKQRTPDARFLTIIGDCIDRRVKILGLNAPEQIQARIIRGEAEPANVRRLEMYRSAIGDPERARKIVELSLAVAGAPPDRYPDEPTEMDA